MFCESCARKDADKITWCPITEEYVCDKCLHIIETDAYGEDYGKF